MSDIKIALFANIVGISGIDCVNFYDCGTTAGYVNEIEVTRCPKDDDACQFKAGTNITINVKFESSLTTKL